MRKGIWSQGLVGLFSILVLFKSGENVKGADSAFFELPVIAAQEDMVEGFAAGKAGMPRAALINASASRVRFVPSCDAIQSVSERCIAPVAVLKAKRCDADAEDTNSCETIRGIYGGRTPAI